jgi:CysZ protein
VNPSPLSCPSFLAGFFAGLNGYLRVPATLQRYGLWHYLLAPALVSLVLSFGILAVVILAAMGLSGVVDRLVEISIGWLDQLINWMVGILMVFAMLAAFVFLHRRIVLIVLAPLLSRLAELTVRGMEGDTFEVTLDFRKAFQRGLHINTRSIILEPFATLSLVVLGFVIPIISPVTSCLVFLVESRFAGFGLIDFPLEYRGYSVAESIAYSKSHRGKATGLGAGYFLLMMIPVIGWMIAPTFGTVAGTVETMERLRKEEG